MTPIVLGSDLDDAQFAWCAERLVAEAPRLTTDPVAARRSRFAEIFDDDVAA